MHSENASVWTVYCATTPFGASGARHATVAFRAAKPVTYGGAMCVGAASSVVKMRVDEFAQPADVHASAASAYAVFGSRPARTAYDPTG